MTVENMGEEVQLGMLDLKHGMLLVFVNREGIVEAVAGNQQFLTEEILLDALIKLKNGEPLSYDRFEDKDFARTSKLGGDSWKRFYSIFKRLPDLQLPEKFDFDTKRERKYLNGIVTEESKHLHLTYYTTEDQDEQITMLIKDIVQPLERREYVLNPRVIKKESALQFRLNCDKIVEILNSHDLQYSLSVASSYKLDVVSGTKWERT